MGATAILLVRHGETDWNRDRRVQGHTDVPLNDEGRRQARALAEELGEGAFDAVYASDLARARETAEILAAPCGLDVTQLEALREKNFGTWEGLTDTDVLDRFPDARPRAWGDAESTEDMSERVLAAVRSIADAHPDRRVLVVTHGGPMRAVLRYLDAEDGRIANCAAVPLLVEDGVLRRVD